MMPDDFQFWPMWLEKNRIGDNQLEEAYNCTPATWRAAIKTALALGAFHFGEMPEQANRQITNAQSGFSSSCVSSPATWACLVFDESCGAAHMTSAAILPILANVACIAALIVGSPTHAFLCSMELAGIEDLFAISRKEFDELLLAWDQPEGKQGHILLVSERPELPVKKQASLSGYWLHVHSTQASVRIMPKAAQKRDIIEFCIGHINEAEGSGPPDVIYTGEEGRCTLLKDKGNLILGAGCEGFWLYPGLSPATFRQTRLEVKLLGQ